MKKAIIIIVLILLLPGVFIVGSRSCICPIPVRIRHYVNKLIGYSDLYKPVILDRFKFYENNFTKTYYLNPTYLDSYEIGIIFNNSGIDATHKFKGKIKVEFFWKDKILFDSVLTSWDTAVYAKGGMNYYKQVSLYRFDIPLQKKYVKDIKVRLTVLEPDQELRKYSDLIKLYIAVSAAPA